MIRKRILCVSYGGGHAAMLTPVIKELEKNEALEVITLGLTTSKSYFESNGISCFGFKDFAFLADIKFHEVGANLVRKEGASNLVAKEESIAYMGINMLDLTDRLGIEKAQEEFSKRGRQAFLPTNFFVKLLKHLSIDFVIATNSPRSEQAAILAARNLRIKSICLVDLFALQEYHWIKDNSYSDKICVLNDQVKEFLVSHGRNAEHIVVTGNPAFDAINFKEKIRSGEAIRERLGNDKTIILYASQVEPDEHPINALKGDPMLPRYIERALRHFIRKNDNYKLLLRFHPSEKLQFIEEERVEYGGEDLHSILHAVDIVVVMSSTVGLEAYIAGKPVISVDLSIFTSDAPYSEMGISKGVSSLDALDNIIRETQQGSQAHLEQGNALNSVMQEIDILLK
ncbi:hypothetical protein TUMSATVNIG1_34220 [Vibrio nigripulchritudo]|uniref:capsular polysaccharide export protein, LipB/KpsS family n=1 Tax=Vibrio nigripulchritudo TaxID=28173 RepID=UPI00190A263F|nr:CDP-glycerol glycerophosphotransferase family protein [Vibrio nigripulchritudo]BCL71456.1 hypothetical protein VNTUMSATTG_33930 [Vibrio nigripulchritudo]BDU32813.1 hypothetical protein TUMSATVNIG1_34220 [Vibrio nigripulchritudo]